MPDQADRQLTRILRMIPLLADGEPHALDGLAEALGIPVATVRGDLHALAARLDDPAGFVEGVQIFLEPDRVSLRSQHFLRPMRLTSAELSALELGLALAAQSVPPDDRAPYARARERLRGALARGRDDADPAELRYASLARDADAAALAALERALRDRRKVRLAYQKPDAESAEHRVVCPYTKVFGAGAWYVVAWCEQAEGVRFFRVDRIVALEALEQRFDRPDPELIEELTRRALMFAGAPAETLRIRFSPRVARWIREREPAEELADGSMIVERPLGDIAWAVRYVLQYGADAEAIAPDSVRREIRRRLLRVLAP